MKESRPKNTQRIEFEQEREEIAKIAMMLTEEYDVFFLLGTAETLLKIEAEQSRNVN